MNSKYWYEVYEEVAELLSSFHSKNFLAVGNELFDRLKEFGFEKYGWFKNVINSIHSVDPIQIFASFNGNKITYDNRLERVNLLIKALGGDTRYEGIDFNGCPAPITLNLLKVRDLDQQNAIWDMFIGVRRNKKLALNKDLFNNAKEWAGINTNSFTIFLFWIDPENFLPLDKWTLNYLESIGKIENRKVNYQQYQSIITDNTLTNYIKIVDNAYLFLIDEKAFAKVNKEYEISKGNNFKIIGLRTLEANKEYHKILKEKTIYPLDSQYEFLNAKDYFDKKLNDKIIEKEGISNFYNQGKLPRINISAIVGKNGSGKSTLIDLILMGIYNLSIEKRILENDDVEDERLLIPNLNFELYFFNKTLFKIIFKNETSIFKFRENDNVFDLTDEVFTLNDFNISDLFYGIVVNYSHYALNSRDYNMVDWITPLSHKNDGYFTPLVINPQRTEGNIDVNREKSLLNSRLLLNLLELHNPEDKIEESFRYVDNGKSFQAFEVVHDTDKILKIRLGINDQPLFKKEKQIIWSAIKKHYELYLFDLLPLRYQASLRKYIINKLLKICATYPKYKKGYSNIIDLSLSFRNYDMLSDSIEKLLKEIDLGEGHIVEKFKQAISFVKYQKLQDMLLTKANPRIELDTYLEVAQTIIDSHLSNKLTIATLLPPAIFKLKFYLKDGSDFNNASSGELQLIGAVSSILYHIRNIESVENDEYNHKFNFVNVFFDEIELYFHPDLQRNFIQRLIRSLNQLPLEGIIGINCIFLTHSPFILSDILESNILKLKNGDIQAKGKYNSFGANIHDLLADEFFLEGGNIGEFAAQKINQIYKSIETATKETTTEDNFMDLEQEINLIGEPVLKKPLLQLWQLKLKELFGVNAAIEYYQNEIEKLRMIS